LIQATAERDREANALAHALRQALEVEDWTKLLDWVTRDGEALDPATLEEVCRLILSAGAAEEPDTMAAVAISGEGRKRGANRLGKALATGVFAEDSAAGMSLRLARRTLKGGLHAAFVDLSESDGRRRFGVLVRAERLPDVWASLTETPFGDGCAILLVSPERDGREKWSAIQATFSLTPAEARLAQHMEEGGTLNEAAAAFGLSVFTVRAQLRAIFAKVGVRRQSELALAFKQFDGLLNAVVPVSAAPSRALARALTPSARALLANAPTLRLFVLSDGRRLCYRQYGDPAGQAVLIFHDSMGSSLAPPCTDDVARELGLRLLIPERPGFGQSDPSPRYSFDSVAADYAALAQGLDLGSVRLAAAASGAGFAIVAARLMGGACERLLLVSGRGGTPTAPAAHQSFLTRYRREMLSSPWLAEAMLRLYVQLYSREFVAGSLKRSTALARLDRAFSQGNAELIDFLTARGAECFARGFVGPLADIACYRTAAEAPARLNTSVVVWHGAEDGSALLEDLLPSLAAPPAVLRRFPGHGHLLMLARWREMLEDLAAERPRRGENIPNT
jgi:pimeloyl-ACP methyl ester carboxylesterase/DNA-binding CsgD family transcriptional regulator